MSMPKAPMNEYGPFPSSIRQVWRTREVAVHRAIAPAHYCNYAPNSHFCERIPLTHTAHSIGIDRGSRELGVSG